MLKNLYLALSIFCTLCLLFRLHYYKLSLLREGGAERMEIATEAVNTLKLSLLNLDIYLLSIQPSKQMFSLPQSTTELFLIGLIFFQKILIPWKILIPLFPAGHPGPERDNNSHNQSVQTLRHCSLIRLLDINKNYIILHEDSCFSPSHGPFPALLISFWEKHEISNYTL